MNQQMESAQTPEERLAGAVMRVLRHIRAVYRTDRVMAHVDHKDFVDAIRPFLRRELLTAKLEVLEAHLDGVERERARRLVMLELGRLDE